jgi:hypothetical protein
VVANKGWWFALYNSSHICWRNFTSIGKAENAIGEEKIRHFRERSILTGHYAVFVEDAFDLRDSDGSLNGTGLVQVHHDKLFLRSRGVM